MLQVGRDCVRRSPPIGPKLRLFAVPELTNLRERVGGPNERVLLTLVLRVGRRENPVHRLKRPQEELFDLRTGADWGDGKVICSLDADIEPILPTLNGLANAFHARIHLASVTDGESAVTRKVIHHQRIVAHSPFGCDITTQGHGSVVSLGQEQIPRASVAASANLNRIALERTEENLATLERSGRVNLHDICRTEFVAQVEEITDRNRAVLMAVQPEHFEVVRTNDNLELIGVDHIPGRKSDRHVGAGNRIPRGNDVTGRARRRVLIEIQRKAVPSLGLVDGNAIRGSNHVSQC